MRLKLAERERVLFASMEKLCGKCALPKALAEIARQKDAIAVANANIGASTSPTEAKPYQEAGEQTLKALRVTDQDMKEFLETWGRCEGCEY